MKTILAPRASTILYNLLKTQSAVRPFLLPANICPMVPITFMKAEVGFEFVDIDPHTLHMDLTGAFDRLKTGQFGGVLYAHTYGEPSTPDDFFTAARRVADSVVIIDDRCLCEPDLDPSVTSADVILYSTGYGKIVDIGAGGYAFMQDAVNYQHQSLPFDSQALSTLEKSYKQNIIHSSRFIYRDLNWLETETNLAWESYRPQVESGLLKARAHRAALNEIYATRLMVAMQFPMAYQNWRFNLRMPDKQKILNAIFASGLFASSHYASLAGIMADGNCPQAEQLAASVINLFNDQHFTTAMAEQVCDVILKKL